MTMTIDSQLGFQLKDFYVSLFDFFHWLANSLSFSRSATSETSVLISVAWDLWTGFWKYWSTSWMNFSGYKIFLGTNDINSICQY